jgi:hypothetical protein
MNQTILSTKTAKINGKNVIVETILGTAHRQDIKYIVDGKSYEYNKFWALNPKFSPDKSK